MIAPGFLLAFLAAEPPVAEPPAAAPAPAVAAETPAAEGPAASWPEDEPISPAPAAPPPVVVVVPRPPAMPPPAPAYVDVGFDIGLLPGLSINGKHRGKKVRNRFSLSFGWNRAAVVDGMSLAFLATVVDEQMNGISASLVANVTKGTQRGVQFTTGYNHARDLRGAQFGSINWASEVRGVQIGLVNIGGHVHGAQIGLVNWAKSADASFALLPITKEGGVRFEVTTSDTALINAGIRLPAKHTYAFIGAGVHPLGTRNGRVSPQYDRGKAWEFGGGFGVHIPASKKVFIDVDLSGWGVTSSLNRGAALGTLGKLRAMVGWQIARRFAIFGGPTLNVLVDATEETILGAEEVGVRTGAVARPGYGWVTYEHTAGDVRIRAWPGFVAGVRL